MPTFNFSIDRIKPKNCRTIYRGSVDDLNGEIWKATKYNGYYVSNYGRVLSKMNKDNRYAINSDIILKQSDNRKGYLFVTINYKQIYVHRLVAQTFIPNPDSLPEVNHIDENKYNNRVDNLEWCTSEYNVSYSVSKRIKKIDANTKEVIAVYNSAIQAAKSIKGNNGAIIMCCKRIKYNTYKGFIWRFEEDNDYSLKHKQKYIRINIITKEETIYNTLKEAAADNNVSIYAISNCVLGKSKTCNGYAWVKR